MTVIYENSPYYDDFNEEKNYQRILFQAERAVQARELTQLQTSLSNQISKISGHVIKDGSLVVDAKIKVDFSKDLMKVEALDSTGSPVFLESFLNQKIIGSNSGAIGTVTSVDQDNLIIYFDYRSGSFDNTNGETINVSYPVGETGPALQAVFLTNALNKGVFAYQDSGIVYTNGSFVHVDASSKPVDFESNIGSYKIGFCSKADVITADEDPSLFDNSIGSPNETARGADRYKGYIELKVYKAGSGETLDDIVVDDEFNEIITVKDGILVRENNNVQYTKIMDTLARRTFDESGSYTVDEFGLQVNDHPTDESKLRLGLEAGKAYVQGYEVETIGTQFIDIDKSRDEEYVNNEFLYPNYGYWLETGATELGSNLNDDSGRLINFAEHTEVYLQDGDTILNPTQTVRIVAITKNINNNWRIYLNGIVSIASVLTSVNKIVDVNDNTKYLGVNPNTGFSITSGKAPIFKLQKTPVKTITLNETSYDVINYKYLTASNSIFTYVAPTNTIDFPFSAGQSVIYLNKSSNGERLSESNGDFSVTVDNVSIPSRLSIVLNGIHSGESNIDVAIRETRTTANHRTKTLTITQDTIVADSEGKITLTNTDFFDFNQQILDVNNNIPLTLTEMESLTVDTGQRDYYYEYPVISGFTAGELYTIFYRYFEHGADGDYFSVDSYMSNDNLTSTGGISGQPFSYNSIPSYLLQDGSNNFKLTDCLDFRRSIDELTSGSIAANLVYPESAIRLDYEYYLPRRDKVYIDKNGIFGSSSGISNNRPELPKLSDGSMGLYNLFLPPWVYNAIDVEVTPIKNKRFTMRDIGEMEERVNKLEYFTSLSLLEAETKNLTITDDFGNNKFKNGILVDNFSGHSVGDTKHPDYKCSIDSDHNVLRPSFKMETFEFEPLTFGGVGFIPPWKVGKNIITKAYSDVVYVDNRIKSGFVNVNPYAVFQYIGMLDLTPATDYWVDTKSTPQFSINFQGANDNLATSVKALEDVGVLGTKWNSWQEYHLGRELTDNYGSVTTGQWDTVSTSKVYRQHYQDGTYTDFQNESDIIGGRHTVFTNEEQIRQITTSDTQHYTDTTLRKREGTVIKVVPETIMKTIGDLVVDTNIVPFMRAREIGFSGRTKPDTEFRAFFDGIDVTQYCQTGGRAGGHGLGTVRSQSSGLIVGRFNLPNNDTHKFRTGKKLFRIIDDVNSPTATSEAQYEATGIIQTKQKTVMSVESPKLVKETVYDENIVKENGVHTNTNVTNEYNTNSTKVDWYGSGTPKCQWEDPIAQSFLIPEKNGVFLSEIVLFFRSIDEDMPIELYIVENENGYPSSRMIPFSRVIKEGSDFHTTGNDWNETFTFSDPIYLTGETEYSLVIKSDSNKYEVFTSELGQINSDGKLIAKQPSLGSLFQSQNSTTWTAVQEKDLMFMMKRCDFITNDLELEFLCKEFGATGNNLEDNVGDNPLLESGFEMDMTTFMLNSDNLIFPTTDLNYKLKLRSGDFSGAYYPIENKKNYELKNIAEIKEVSGEDAPISFKATFKTNGAIGFNYLSPVIHKFRNSLIGIENLIDGDQTIKNAGTYVTKPVQLTNESDDIKVYLDVLEPDANTEVKVYFKNDTYIPRFVNTDYKLPIFLTGRKMNIYWIDDNTGDVTLKGNLRISEINDNVTKDLYVGQVTNVDAFRNSSGSNQLPANTTVYLFPDEENIGSTFPTLLIPNTGQTFNKGDYVINNNNIFRALDDVTSADTVNAPSANSLWLSIPYTTTDGELQTDSSLEWREMVRTEARSNINVGFTEYVFVPKQEIVSPFNSFNIKIELKANNAAIVPFAKNLRALALY